MERKTVLWIGYIFEHFVRDSSFTCIKICGKIEEVKKVFCITAQMKLFRGNEQVEINMNIVKFLETMREDAGRCKRELEKIENPGFLREYDTDSARVFAFEMAAKYGGVVEGIPDIIDIEENYKSTRSLRNLFCILYGRLYTCYNLGGKGIYNAKIVKPGHIEFKDTPNKLFTLSSDHLILHSSDIQKIDRGSKISISIKLADGVTKEIDLVVRDIR